MMKRTLAMFLGIASVLSLFAAEADWNMGAGWKTEKPGEYTIAYPGTGWTGLGKKFATAPGKFYKLSWEGKQEGEGSPKFQIFMLSGERKSYTVCLLPKNEWASSSFYAYSGNSTSLEIRFILDPSQAGTIFLRNLKWEELTDADLKKNLIPNANFEAPLSGFWRNIDWKKPIPPAKIVTGQNFITGTQSLQLNFDGEPAQSGTRGVQTSCLPAIPGATFVLSFWAKADSPVELSTAFSLWSPFQHKGAHFNVHQKYKVGTEWKQYTWKIQMSSDLTKYPDFADQIGEIVFMVWNKQFKGLVWLDDISYHLK